MEKAPIFVVEDLFAEGAVVDLDIDATTVGEVARVDNEFLVVLTGGFGWADDMNEGVRYALDGLERVDFTFRLSASASPRMNDAYEKVLVSWRDRLVPLRLVGVYGEYALMEDENCVLRMPRTYAK